MRNAHYFFVENISDFVASLTARGYSRVLSQEEGTACVCYSKVISNVVMKEYSFDEKEPESLSRRIGVRYRLMHEGKSLAALAKKLTVLNTRYRHTLPGWKTKREASVKARKKRLDEVSSFLRQHGELIECFKYQADNRLTEGNHSFNLEIASTPREQTICFGFIKALVDAYAPHRIRRSRREPDKPSLQRNGWIKRYAHTHKRRGWSPLEISRRIQRELREGTWNERSRLQYNLAPNTICRIAGLRLHAYPRPSTIH